MKQFYTAILLLVFTITSCTPAAAPVPTVTPTNLPATATATATPTTTPVQSSIDGTIFFDMNANGFQDEATFLLLLDNEGQLPLIIQTLFPDVSGDNGEMITVDEPGLSDLNVCTTISNVEYCAKTGSTGKYALENLPVEWGEQINLIISDPNAETPQIAMKYANLFIKKIEIPAHEGTDISFPKQVLYKTKIVQLDEINAITGEENSIGVLQGQLTLPLQKSDFHSIENYVDLNPKESEALAWNGINQITDNFPNFNPKAFGDNHPGLDFLSNQNNEFVIASSYGEVFNYTIPGQINTKSGNYQLRYGHINKNLLGSLVSEVYRGQILAVIGDEGTNHTHIHWEILGGGNQDAEGFPGIYDPFYSTSLMETGCVEYEGIRYEHLLCIQENSPSWTVYNTPVFAK